MKIIWAGDSYEFKKHRPGCRKHTLQRIAFKAGFYAFNEAEAAKKDEEWWAEIRKSIQYPPDHYNDMQCTYWRSGWDMASCKPGEKKHPLGDFDKKGCGAILPDNGG
jgi:hypothetical protein